MTTKKREEIKQRQSSISNTTQQSPTDQYRDQTNNQKGQPIITTNHFRQQSFQATTRFRRNALTSKL
jgi:hypothetical protein